MHEEFVQLKNELFFVGFENISNECNVLSKSILKRVFMIYL